MCLFSGRSEMPKLINLSICMLYILIYIVLILLFNQIITNKMIFCPFFTKVWYFPVITTSFMFNTVLFITAGKSVHVRDYFHLTFVWHYTRDGSVGPVSRYWEHFTEISWWDFKTATSLANLYNGRKSLILEEIISFYPHIFVHLHTIIAN